MSPNHFIQRRQLRLLSLLGMTLLCMRIAYLISLRQPIWPSGWGACLTFAFLPWNLFLAWIPFWLSRSLLSFGRKQPFAWFVVGMWLLFLPNAPYLVTDLIHLRPRANVPFWYDGLLLLVFALVGLELFVASLQRVVLWWRLQFSERSSQVFLGSILLLTGIGIYAGRFFRWNSWDAVLRPWIILEDMLMLVQRPTAFWPDVGLILIFPICLGVWYVSRCRGNGNDKTQCIASPPPHVSPQTYAPTTANEYDHRAVPSGSPESEF